MKNFFLFCIIAFFLFIYVNKSSVTKKKSFSSADSGSSKIEIISYNGEEVDLSSHLVSGGITIFDFYADWCGPCKSLSSNLEPYVKNREGVYLKKINIKDWNSPVSKYYNIRSIPSVWIYDKNGNETVKKIGSFEEIKRIIEKL